MYGQPPRVLGVKKKDEETCPLYDQGIMCTFAHVSGLCMWSGRYLVEN